MNRRGGRPEAERKVLAEMGPQVGEVAQIEPGAVCDHIARHDLVDLRVDVVDMAAPGSDDQGGGDRQDKRKRKPGCPTDGTARMATQRCAFTLRRGAILKGPRCDS